MVHAPYPGTQQAGITITYSQATSVSIAKATGLGGSGTWTLLELFTPLLVCLLLLLPRCVPLFPLC